MHRLSSCRVIFDMSKKCAWFSVFPGLAVDLLVSSSGWIASGGVLLANCLLKYMYERLMYRNMKLPDVYTR